MKRLTLLTLAAGVIGGGMYLSQKYDLKGLKGLSLVSRDSTSVQEERPPIERQVDTIRVATFDLSELTDEKLDNPSIVAALGQMMSRFDVVAAQGLGAKCRDPIEALREAQRTEAGPRGCYIAPAGFSAESEGKLAFFYDQASLEFDASLAYRVDDPDNLLSVDPLVGAFRARGPDPKAAFTFSLINAHLPTNAPSRENSTSEFRLLADVLRAVRADGRNEDDVILALNPEGGAMADEPPPENSVLKWIAHGSPANVRGTRVSDGFLIDVRATSEFSERGGALDVSQELGWTEEETLIVTDSLPIWAEFSIYEGGPAMVADAAADDARPPD